MTLGEAIELLNQLYGDDRTKAEKKVIIVHKSAEWLRDKVSEHFQAEEERRRYDAQTESHSIQIQQALERSGE